MEPSAAPTAPPSAALSEPPSVPPSSPPSVAPTALPPVISFNSSLVLRNVSSAALDSASQYVVAISVASTLQIRYECVQFVSQTEGAATRSDKAAHYEVSVAVRVIVTQSDLLTPSSIDDWNSSTPFNATQLYSSMRDTLGAASRSDALTRAVRAYSAVFAARDTLFVSNVSAAVSSFSVQAPSDPGDDTEEGEDSSSAAYDNWLHVAPVLAILFGACLLSLCLYATCLGTYYRGKYVYSARRDVEEGPLDGYEQVRTYKGLSIDSSSRHREASV
jgi:hypothetical protein